MICKKCKAAFNGSLPECPVCKNPHIDPTLIPAINQEEKKTEPAKTEKKKTKVKK
jgi:hypothetical protein